MNKLVYQTKYVYIMIKLLKNIQNMFKLLKLIKLLKNIISRSCHPFPQSSISSKLKCCFLFIISQKLKKNFSDSIRKAFRSNKNKTLNFYDSHDSKASFFFDYVVRSTFAIDHGVIFNSLRQRIRFSGT